MDKLLASYLLEMSSTTPQGRALLLATALSGALLAVALRSSALLAHPDAEKIWMAALYQYLGADNKRLGKKNGQHAFYDWTRSTEENYQSGDGRNYGRFAAIRDHLDKRYHSTYTKSRQLFQDAIIESLLSANQTSRCQTEPWIVFTAGSMGSGKSHTLKELGRTGRFPLHSFVTVDPDQIRHRLPEFDEYARRNAEEAGFLTRKECGMMSEIMTIAALQRGQNVIVDGTLRDAAWYENYFRELRQANPNLRIAIIHVTAPRQVVFARALVRACVGCSFEDVRGYLLTLILSSLQSRSKDTGRVVPRDLLERVMEQVPHSVDLLRPSVDFSIDLHNPGNGLEVTTKGMDWELFTRHWAQVCPQEGKVLGLPQ